MRDMSGPIRLKAPTHFPRPPSLNRQSWALVPSRVVLGLLRGLLQGSLRSLELLVPDPRGSGLGIRFFVLRG